MRILITGACGFVGGVLARAFRDAAENVEIIGLDNLVRSGSETNRTALRQAATGSLTRRPIRASWRAWTAK
jgi:CDP-paratose 2-epimerase